MEHLRSNLSPGLRRIGSLSYKVWFVVFVVFAITAIFALRQNNENMIRLRNDVYAADQSGTGVEAALDKLRVYVYGHMNTDLTSGGNAIKPPIQLKYTYDRLEAKAQAAANNSQLYTDAENYCQSAVPASVSISGRGRITCVSNYILSHGGHAPAPIPPALYQFDFASPAWSPDFAGWSLVAAIISLTAFVISLAIQKFERF